MNTRHEISKELRDWASPLAEMPYTMPYSVPKGYFDTLTTEILSGVKAAEVDEPEHIWSQEIPFEIPQGYFEQLSSQVLATIKEQDITATLPKDNPYITPPGYFEALPQQMLAAAKKNDKTKVISIHKLWKQLKWAAAALLICGIGLGSYKMFRPYGPAPIANPEQAIANMSPAVVHEYIQQNIDDFDIDVIMNSMNAGNAQTMTKQLDTREIQQYLNATGWGQSELN
jgi:hypothetical protein